MIELEQFPTLVDPVMVATSGARLLQEEAVSVYRRRLFSRAIVVTPNLDEAAALWGAAICSRASMREAGNALVWSTSDLVRRRTKIISPFHDVCSTSPGGSSEMSNSL